MAAAVPAFAAPDSAAGDQQALPCSHTARTETVSTTAIALWIFAAGDRGSARGLFSAGILLESPVETAVNHRETVCLLIRNPTICWSVAGESAL